MLYSRAARVWLDKLAVDSGFSIDYIQDPHVIDSSFLEKYQLFIQLDYAPYAWGDTAMKAFRQYIEQGRGGWIGFHHASLLGEFDGYPMWQWFSTFMGDHTVIWMNGHYAARNIYIFMGHSPDLFENPVYATIFRNAIFWAARKGGMRE
ncbi:ThuA domain-containing protein [Flavitalea flava]